MKRIPFAMLLAILPLFPATSLHAQSTRAERQDNIQQQKIAFFTENLRLTPAESSRFWPVYNDYQNRREKITNDRNSLLKYFESNRNNLSETEVNDMIAKYIAFQLDETRLLESYTKKFQEFLPANKVMQIYIVELEFKKWLLQNLRQNKTTLTPRK